MQNFVYKNPTEIIFGRGTIGELATRVPRDVPVMFTFGGGSIRRNGVYEQVVKALAGREVIEFSGIEPNPSYETCMKAVEIVRQRRVGFLLAVGGGSVIDGTKFIGAAACYEGPDPWEILRTVGQGVNRAIPLGTVLTLPATGTESNGNSVISRKSTAEKLFFSAACSFPVFSVLDPETTFTLPRAQIRNGIVDAFVHVMEQYMTYPADAPLQDRLAESVLQTLVEVGPKTLAEPRDYEARASFMWSATLALNTLISCGVPQDWATHMIGHEVTALYGPAHAETLAVVLPGVWQHQLAKKQAKLRQYGQRVWNVSSAEAAIAKTEEFFHALDMPTRLSAYQIDAAAAAKAVQARFTERGSRFGEHGDIDGPAAAAILRLRA
jgi:NADP-dependent alcohol dehydrogenase